MKELIVEVNPYLEFINSILLTSKYNEITAPFVGYGLMTDETSEYIETIKRKFNPYSYSDIYKKVEKMIPNGFTFSRPVELMLSLGESCDFTMQFIPSELCIKYCGGLDNINELLTLLKFFAEEIDYISFFESTKQYYNPFLRKVKGYSRSYPFISLIEEQFGKSQNSYRYVISELMKGNFGVCFYNDKVERADLFSVFTTKNITEDIKTNEFNRGALSANVVFHELSHSFINPLTDKYFNIANNYLSAYENLKKYKLPDYRSGYGDWIECINEHFVRAMAIHLLRKCDRQEWADEYLNDDLYCGYLYIPQILELYKYYDNNRLKYRTFDEFYPVLLEVFKRDVNWPGW